MLEKLSKRGGRLLDRLPGSLSSELMSIVAQGETILAKRLQILLVDALTDVTSKESKSGSEPAQSEESAEQMLQELIKTAGEVFERLPAEHSTDLIQGVLEGTTPLASLLRRSSSATQDEMSNFVKSAAAMFDTLSAVGADCVIADVLQLDPMDTHVLPLPAALEASMGEAQNSFSNREPSNVDTDIEHVAVVSELIAKVLDSVETRLASDPASLMVLGDGAGVMNEDLRTEHDAEASEVSLPSKARESQQGSLAELQEETTHPVKPDGTPTPRTPLSSIPEDSAVSISAWVPGKSSVPQSLSTILALLKFNNVDVASGYDVFDYDMDGRVSLRDLRRKCQELELDVSPDDIYELFQALADARTNSYISREAWQQCLMSGDADGVLTKRGVEPEFIHITHAVQDTLDDIVATISRQMAQPKDPKKARAVSFSEAIVAGHGSCLPPTWVAQSPPTNIRQPEVSVLSTRCPQRSLQLQHLDGEPKPSTWMMPDHLAPQIVDEEDLSRLESNTAKEKPAMIVSAETLQSLVTCHRFVIPYVLIDFVAVQVTNESVTTRDVTMAQNVDRMAEVSDSVQIDHEHFSARTGESSASKQAGSDVPGLGGLDLSAVVDSSLTSSHVSEGALDLEALSVAEKYASRRHARRHARPWSSAPNQPALALEDNLLYKEFIRFSRGAGSGGSGFPAPPCSSAANVPSSSLSASARRGRRKTQIDFAGFLEFMKSADLVPRFTQQKVIHGVYQFIGKDGVTAGLDGETGCLGWAGFQQGVGMVAALCGVQSVLGNEAVKLINASGAKQFGKFPSQVDEQQCEDGAHAAFVEMFATPHYYARFSSLDRRNQRGMSYDEAKAAIRELKMNPMFVSPSLIGQEFRKVVTSASTPRESSRTQKRGATHNAPRIDAEQFGEMMNAISRRIGPRLLLRHLCISLASHNEGHNSRRPDTARIFDNGAPNAPHKPNPRAFLCPCRPSSAPRGLRQGHIPEAVLKSENFLKPTPPKWRPSGPVDSKSMALAVATLTPSSMLGEARGGDGRSLNMSKDAFFDGEEADLERLHQDRLLEGSVSRSKQSTSTSIHSHPDQMQSPERSLHRLEKKAREHYTHMLNMNDEVSLHRSITSWVDRSHTQPDSSEQDHVDLCFPGGRVIRAGRKERPQHLVPTAPSGRSSLHFARGHKRVCPAPVYETAPVLSAHKSETKPATPRRGDTLLRKAHIMADRASSKALCDTSPPCFCLATSVLPSCIVTCLLPPFPLLAEPSTHH